MTMSENFPRLTLPSLYYVICRSEPRMKSNKSKGINIVICDWFNLAASYVDAVVKCNT